MISRLRAVAIGALLSTALLFAALSPTPAAAGIVEAAAATEFSADEFVEAFDNAPLSGLAPIGPAPSITGTAALDNAIRLIAEERGYIRRPTPNRELESIDGRLLQPEAAAAWAAIRDAAAGAGISISLTSAYRDTTRQAELFRNQLTGSSDPAIHSALSLVAAPGYSRHHTGYAIDLASEGKVLHAFATTEAYRWLSTDNFANAKTHGWIPSYPAGSSPAGPDPEPWELVWIGTTNIVCAQFEQTAEQPFCDAIGSSFDADIAWLSAENITTGCGPERFCPDGEFSRAQGATMIWRMIGSPASGTPPAAFSDVDDGRYFSEAVGWMVESGYTTGTSPTLFSPDAPLTRAQFVTFLWRLVGQPAAPPHPFLDVSATSFASHAIAWAAEVGVTTGTTATTFEPNATTSRGQAAAFLHRFASLPSAQ